MTRPQFLKEGWRRNGPGRCNCPDCGAIVSTNALARASHARACYAERQRDKEANRQRTVEVGS